MRRQGRGTGNLTKGLRWTELRRRMVAGEVWAVVAGGARGEGRCRGWSRVQRPRGSSGGRGRAGALLGRGPGAAEWPNPGGAEDLLRRRRRGSARVWAATDERRCGGATSGTYRAAEHPWRARPGGDSRRGLRRGSRRFPLRGRAIREEGDGPGAWGRAGSGKGETRALAGRARRASRTAGAGWWGQARRWGENAGLASG